MLCKIGSVVKVREWTRHSICCFRCLQVSILRAEKGMYVAEIDGQLLMKIGPRSFAPNSEEYQEAEKGEHWSTWLKKGFH